MSSLIKWSGATICTSFGDSDICITNKHMALDDDNTKLVVTEKWFLDSIEFYQKLDKSANEV